MIRSMFRPVTGRLLRPSQAAWPSPSAVPSPRVKAPIQLARTQTAPSLAGKLFYETSSFARRQSPSFQLVRQHGAPPLQSAVLPFLPLALFKSTTSLRLILVLSRAFFSFLPYSVFRRIRSAAVASPYVPAFIKRSLPKDQPHGSQRITYIGVTLVGIPIFLVGLLVLSSLERTPVSGRLRMIVLSAEEERELMAGIMQVGEQQSTDWLKVLEVLQGQEGGGQITSLPPPTTKPAEGQRTLFGHPVLPDDCWQVWWARNILSELEKAVPLLEGMQPPLSHPLRLREAECDTENEAAAMEADYDLFVVDAPEKNAFSFGFAPPPKEGARWPGRKRGVIVLFTGFLDEILAYDEHGFKPEDFLRSRPSARKQDAGETSSWSLSSIFSALLPRRPAPTPGTTDEAPAFLAAPTLTQTTYVGVLIAHELSHLLLSHSVESLASGQVLMPYIASFLTDIARTLLYPATFVFGPFVNDWLGTAFGGSAAVATALTFACESRAMEREADLLGLRLLANAGVDPRHAIVFWEKRAAHEQEEAAQAVKLAMAEQEANGGAHGQVLEEGVRIPLLDSHPETKERVRFITEELQSWPEFVRTPGRASTH